MISTSWRCFTPIGALHIHSSRNQQVKIPTEASFEITFVPPLWLSNVVVEYGVRFINYSHNLNFSQRQIEGNLKHHTVNRNPFFLQAIETIDVDSLKESFEKGLA